jgi:glycosyltransferase involved in cell wall biosynthesis
MSRKLFYFGLEPLFQRYTYQLSEEWIPDTFKDSHLDFVSLRGPKQDQEIKVGAVLDATGRGIYSMGQCQEFLKLINQGEVRNGDIVLLQDFWTPGIESVFYALDLYGIQVKFYSMLHAQSVDEYDFTWNMQGWMRYFELGIDKFMSGIFVGSTVHRDQLRQAGFKSPIHVVSLPYHTKLAEAMVPDWQKLEKRNNIVFTSRFDKEKNPYFMMEVAKQFLKENKDFTWTITTSGKEIRSSLPNVVKDLRKFASEEPRFIIKEGISKQEYYKELATSKVLFNSSLQDYVSWTVIEGTTFGIDLCFPRFRSFPEFLPEDRMYHPFDVGEALRLLGVVLNDLRTHEYIPRLSNLGRLTEKHIIENDITQEVNIWHESEYLKSLIEC